MCGIYTIVTMHAEWQNRIAPSTREAETECCFSGTSLFPLPASYSILILYSTGTQFLATPTYITHRGKKTKQAKQKTKNNRETTRKAVNGSSPLPWMSLVSQPPPSLLSAHLIQSSSDARWPLSELTQCGVRFDSPAEFYHEPLSFLLIPQPFLSVSATPPYLSVGPSLPVSCSGIFC